MATINAIQKRTQGRWILLLLALLFITPMIVAWSLYKSDPHWLLAETVNSGQLLQPPLDFSQLQLSDPQGKPLDSKEFDSEWLMVYVTPSPCNTICQANLYKIRQVWLALGKDMDRVQRVLVQFPTPQTKSPSKVNLAKEFPGMEYAQTTLPQLQHFFAKSSLSGIAPQQGALYLVDPHNNLMMVYKPDAAPKGMLKDLTRLLNTSQIG